MRISTRVVNDEDLSDPQLPSLTSSLDNVVKTAAKRSVAFEYKSNMVTQNR